MNTQTQPTQLFNIVKIKGDRKTIWSKDLSWEDATWEIANSNIERNWFDLVEKNETELTVADGQGTQYTFKIEEA